MLSGANTFEISEIQEVRNHEPVNKAPECYVHRQLATVISGLGLASQIGKGSKPPCAG
jgi:hypothetical protein